MESIFDRDIVLNDETLPIIKHICDSMPGGFFIYKAEGDGELIYVNKALVELFGCDNVEQFRRLTGNTFRGIVHPDDFDSVQQSIEEQIGSSDDNLDYVEYRIIKADGSVRWVVDFGKYLETESYGGVFYVFIDDATDRLQERINELEEVNERLARLNRELEETHTRDDQYRRAILHNAYLFCEVNLSKNKFISASGQTISGELIDIFEYNHIPKFTNYTDYIKYWSDKLTDTDPKVFRQFFSIERLIASYYDDDPEQIMECSIDDLSGRERTYQFIMLIGRNKFTKDVIGLSVIKDITSVSENKKLFQQALQEANAANIARQTFLDNISHDIRTPLNSIIGFTDLIKSNYGDDERLSRYLTNINISGKQLLKIVNQSLEITHMESGKAVITKHDCNIEEILRNVEKRIEPYAMVNHIHVKIDMTEVEHFDLYSDAQRLEEVLWQLLDNAVKYNRRDGHAELTVVEDTDSPEGFGVYTFTVKDDGIGIPKDHQSAIFEPFKRVANTTNSGVFGSGLGLVVVKNIVDMMKGEITFTSEPEVGTEFTVKLVIPLQPVQRHQKGDIPVLPAQFMERLNILVVEDNEINLEIQKEMLEMRGCIVDTAENGKEAVEIMTALTEKKYDVILMDIQTPFMDGCEAARRIRRLPDKSIAQTPIIAVSANAFEDDYERSLSAGMNAHLPKPVDMNELEFMIGKILGVK